ncbi:flavin reductase family protein [Litoricolaceae bacterium]|nr:flavin reductase family protein [Litorivicinaceae bacterium]
MGCLLEEFVGIDPKVLRNALGHFATGVTIVTAQTDRGPVGITVNSFASVSLNPALVLWSVDRNGSRYEIFRHAEYYAIHVLRADQGDLAFKVVKNAGDFGDLDLIQGDHGAPIIPECLAIFECQQTEVYRAGDHDIILGEVKSLRTMEGDALGFFKGQMMTVTS